MSNKEKIWNYLTQFYTPIATAGIMGNLQNESGLESYRLQGDFSAGYTKSIQYAQQVDSGLISRDQFAKEGPSGGGWGLAQWTFYTRKYGLYDLAKSKGVSIGDLDMQLEYLIKELNSYGLTNKLNQCKTILEASNIILLQFEKPRDQSTRVQQLRANLGQTIYNECINLKKNEKFHNSINFNPYVCMMTHSTCYRQTRTMTVLGVLWHSTGCNNPNLWRYVQPYEGDANYNEAIKKLGYNKWHSDWNHIEYQAGLNAWIGKFADGTVGTVQTMPWNYRPWGCGSGPKGSCNNGWVQFEICEDSLTDRNYAQAVWDEAIRLTAYICKTYNLDPLGYQTVNGVKVPVITCHAESHSLGLGCNHADPLHWFPKILGKGMKEIRNEVNDLIKNGSSTSTPTIPGISSGNYDYIINNIDYSYVFNADYYYNRYPDLQVALGKDNQKLFQHFLHYGIQEGRWGISTFNVLAYRDHNPDLQKAYGLSKEALKNYVIHYIVYGRNEKRICV